MSISLDSLDILEQYPEIYTTSNEKYVIGKDFERILSTPEYSILGFLNGYMYCSYGNYLSKNTKDGLEISTIYLPCSHATFIEGKKFFYVWHDDVIIKVFEDLTIGWEIRVDNFINSVVMDTFGNIYVTFVGYGSIRKYDPEGNSIIYITESNDVTKACTIYQALVTEGGRYLNVFGAQIYGLDATFEYFLDTYDMQTFTKINRSIINGMVSSLYFNCIPADPEWYMQAVSALLELESKVIIKNNYVYLFTGPCIMKINKDSGISSWSFYSSSPAANCRYIKIPEYDNSSHEEFIYYNVSMSSGYILDSNDNNITSGFGKLTINGETVWEINEVHVDDVFKYFKMAIYENKIYTSFMGQISPTKSYTLSLNGGSLLFKVRDGRLLKITESNKDIYVADNYQGYNLLGRERNGNVRKVIYVPLRHDTGNVVTDTGKAILIPVINPAYYNEENFEDFNLLYSSFSDTPIEVSVLMTKDGKSLHTKLGTFLRTMHGYNQEELAQNISTDDNEVLTTEDDRNIIRNRAGGYVRYSNLLADRHLFSQNIITKIEGLDIKTKKEKYSIMRKLRVVYRYILSKLNDMNIVTEWLIQNDILNTVLPEYVDELRHHTVSAIQTVQMAGIPTLYDVQPTKKNQYTFNKYTYDNQLYGSQIFVCNNLPFTKRYANTEDIYTDSIGNLVEQGMMRPFLLFLNGKAIKWTDCTIIKDWSYTYVVIRNTNAEENNLECVIFPCNVRYGEDTNIYDTKLNLEHLYFDANGLLTENVDDISIRIEITDANVNGDTQIPEPHENGTYLVEVPTTYNQLASEQNILVFEDGKLASDAYHKIIERSRDMFTYVIDSEPHDMVFKTFYYIKGNDYYGIETKVPDQETKDKYLHDNAEATENTGYNHTPPKSIFSSPFDFKLYREKSYERNVANAVEYIMGYDINLLMQYYKDKSNFRTYTYTGEDLIKRAANERKPGWIFLSRSRKSSLDDYVMVFVDGKLYEYNHQIEYSGHEFAVPIFDHVKHNSLVEILHFRNVNNETQTLTVDNEIDDYLDSNLRYGNFMLFGHSAPETEFNSSPSYVNDPNLESGAIMYDLEFDFKNNFDKNDRYMSTSIKLANPYYYGKKISIASKRQFRYMYYTVPENWNRKVNLTAGFRFCHEKNHYMVFIDSNYYCSDFDLNVAITETELNWNYLTFPPKSDANPGSRIEIFYLPDAYESLNIHTQGNDEISSHMHYHDNGLVEFPMSELNHPFDKDMNLLFCKYMKIPYSKITNISTELIHVDLDYNNMTPVEWAGLRDNTYVIDFYRPSDILTELFSYSDEWSSIIHSLTPNSKWMNELFLSKLVTKASKK